ncbi:MAG: type II toxin-antitoxin system RelE/ParE family toxin [Propionivibrio sp.]|uniref:type II toxin-antitoxin system RelE/ParE family toxin n=1 Tax=Propionivibrio sp. TaxID=2212460 RepID=UPI0025FF66FA|nr:type II toxin-antitoxin system RelE/ParE family toxin [Propionivibrio sp.]MBK8894532.1 type II toxin-antitoxin system RelE/ParE family toxin [Propionivibrio sp.]
MILSFKHKGLARLRARLQGRYPAQHAERLRLILGRLSVATAARDMDLAGLRLHALKGERKGVWSVWVSGNWRITFQFVGRDAELVDYEDYH